MLRYLHTCMYFDMTRSCGKSNWFWESFNDKLVSSVSNCICHTATRNFEQGKTMYSVIPFPPEHPPSYFNSTNSRARIDPMLFYRMGFPSQSCDFYLTFNYLFVLIILLFFKLYSCIQKKTMDNELADIIFYTKLM